MRLSTRVVRAAREPGGWRILAEGPDGPVEDRADWLIVANGTLSTPDNPVLEGTAAFVAVGARIVGPADLGDDADLDGAHVVVLGYGKSATDIAVAAVSSGAASTTVIALSVPWKLPERMWGLPFERVLTSRLGEHLLWAPFHTLGGRALRRADTLLRWGFHAAFAGRMRPRTASGRRSARPAGSPENISHLVTPGFDVAVEAGHVDLRVGAQVARLGAGVVHLIDGSVLPADLLVTATGYRTEVDFLDEATRALLRDDDDGMPLHRHTMPPRVPRLVFAGWSNSFRSPIASEIQSVWIAAPLHGALRRPGGHDQPCAAPTGLSIRDQDRWLQEAGAPVPWSVRIGEVLHALDPAAYAGMHERLHARLRSMGLHVPAPVAGDAADQLLLAPGEPDPALLRRVRI